MKKLAVSALLVLFASDAGAQSVLYGIGFGGELITINTSTGAGTMIGNTGLSSCDAMTVDPSGRFYVISNKDDLYRVESTHACAVLVADVSNVEYVEELAFGPNFTLYGAGSLDADVAAERLMTIDPQTAAGTIVGPFNAAHDVDAMAYSQADAVFYGSDLTTGRWLRIDPATGAATDLGPQNSNLFALAFSPGGVLYGTAHTNTFGSPSTLVTVDRLTGVATPVGAVGFNSVAGLAFGFEYSACIGDLNADLTVDLTDLSTLLSHYGSIAATACDGDLDGNGDVDLSDLATMLANYGNNCES